MDQQQKQYAALAPILALCGIFVDPMASTLLPLMLFFIFFWRHKDFASQVALRSADLTFTVQLLIILASLFLSLFIALKPITDISAQHIMTVTTFFLLGYMIISLLIATGMAFRGTAYKHWFSFRLAERIFTTLHKRNNVDS